jgi:recombination protein RecA
VPDTAIVLGDLVAARYLRRGDAPLPSRRPRWCRDDLAGRLTEISSARFPAPLTAALGLVRDAQRQGETCAWVCSTETCFYPPDAAEGGVDLDALAVVRVPDATTVLRAADKLVRSGAFGLVILDVPPARGATRWEAALGRLLGLARKHDTAVVLITAKGGDVPSLGSLISLRGEARRAAAEGATSLPQRAPTEGRPYCVVEVRVLKDKRRAPGWTHAEPCRGPAGLR